MCLQLSTSLSVNDSFDSLANCLEIGGQLLIDLVKDTFSYLEAINDLQNIVNSINFQGAYIVLLSTRCGIEATLIKND